MYISIKKLKLKIIIKHINNNLNILNKMMTLIFIK